jgi:hypothetical protein
VLAVPVAPGVALRVAVVVPAGVALCAVVGLAACVAGAVAASELVATGDCVAAGVEDGVWDAARPMPNSPIIASAMGMMANRESFIAIHLSSHLLRTARLA